MKHQIHPRTAKYILALLMLLLSGCRSPIVHTEQNPRVQNTPSQPDFPATPTSTAVNIISPTSSATPLIASTNTLTSSPTPTNIVVASTTPTTTSLAAVVPAKPKARKTPIAPPTEDPATKNKPTPCPYCGLN